MCEWLDRELARELRPVEAPEALWGRLETARRRPLPGHRRALRLALFAAALAVVAAVLGGGRHSAGIEKLAARELDRSASLELRSGDAVEIAAWLRRQAGLDLAIAPSARIQLKGARVVRERGVPVGEVAYQVRGSKALLLVARTGGPFHAPAKHGGLAWQHGRQVYAVACAPPEAACALCHANL